LPHFVGTSPEFMALLDTVRRMAGSDATVLVMGETGTGKELAARAIHYLGARREQPFVPVNCGAIPDSLFESEFFGHVRGAFTDARVPNRGLVAAAEGGTLFLDEVETLSAKGQIALLRFLQDHSYRALGAREFATANVRVIAATNTDLHQLVKTGGFREDLIYRLRVLSITMPPLHARHGDVALLIEHFLNRFSRLYKTAPKTLDAESLQRLIAYRWPGNVRELESVLHAGFLLADSQTIHIDPVQLNGESAPMSESRSATLLEVPLDLGFSAAKAEVVVRFERTFLMRALVLSHGNISEAARQCGKDRRSLGRLLKKHGINCQGYRS
jgi:two-component system, NtrC family, response regulator GlrR